MRSLTRGRWGTSLSSSEASARHAHLSFEANVITKLEGLGAATNLTNKNQDSSTPTNISGGKWYHWGGKYRRVPHDWTFPNKMTLHAAML